MPGIGRPAIAEAMRKPRAKPARASSALLWLLLVLWLAPRAPAGVPPQAAGEAVPPDRQAEISQIASEAGGALRQGDFSGAIRGYEKLVKLAPQGAEFHANLGIAYYSAGRFREAARACQEALKLKPGLIHAHYFLGVSLAEAGECKLALPYLERDYPRVSDSQLKRSMGTDALRCAMAQNQADKAVRFVGWLGRDFPDDPDVLYLSSHVYSDLSTRASERLLETAPGSYQAHQLNAEVLELQGKLSDAAQEYGKVLSLNPRLPEIHYRLGRLLLAGPPGPTTLDQARREFQEELKIDPDSAVAEYELGEMARQARQWNDAIQHFERASKLDPEFAAALVGLGKSLVSAGRPQDAVAPLQAAVKLEPQDPVAHYQLSFAYRRLGRDAEAEKELAAYQRAQEQLMRQRETIRGGILGRMSEPQTAQPPE